MGIDDEIYEDAKILSYEEESDKEIPIRKLTRKTLVSSANVDAEPKIRKKQIKKSAEITDSPSLTHKNNSIKSTAARKDNKSLSCDIDIGIVAENKLSFYRLARLNDAMNRLNTLYTIDVVDFTNRDDGFSKEAMETIEVLHENEDTDGTI